MLYLKFSYILNVSSQRYENKFLMNDIMTNENNLLKELSNHAYYVCKFVFIGSSIIQVLNK